MGILNRAIGGSTRRTGRFSLAGRWLPAGAVMTGAVLLGGVVPASAQTLTWSVVHSPNRRATPNSLDAVSCFSAKMCMATGDRLTAVSGAPVTLAERWDGTQWSLVPSPNASRVGDELVAVSCGAATACMAVGFSQGGPTATLAESWNGTRWSVVRTPSLGGTGSNLGGVSCVSAAACTAVGAVSPDGAALRTVIESWNGTRWSVVPSPNPADGGALNSVSCLSAHACMAVGFSGGETGFHGTLAESWNGTRWTVLPSPNPGNRGDFLNGVSCVSPGTCTAAGEAFHSSGPTTSLIESWNGSRWSVVPSPSPGSSQTLLNGVSCTAKNACNAAGTYDTAATPAKTLVESWDGTSWSVANTPNPGAENHTLNAVSCVSPDFCMAAGVFFSHQASFRTLTLLGTASG
jgi:hypothetical protein